ncbi:RNA exonuclease 1 homolog [Thalassophryne amazonica]|uniref:RNA exonuclease 1 homolog n=1 Tax=Thalassophryne amazonica TaxID=390379 RepID=UPI0014710A4C|nr:RNA exonuclease 1 homolog [Thalassophryne amazonica]
MLRSTGFFRGIDCPFYAEGSAASGSRSGCGRPYCHFRHSQQRRATNTDSNTKEQGYDPFNPEVVRPQEQQDGKPAASGDISGALELVNKAIEEVRSEVEREKRKLSRIGDDQYNSCGMNNSSASDIKNCAAAGSHLAYDPGEYQLTSGGYNPTPRSSKYTLDADIQGNQLNSLEYVPTLLKKPVSRMHIPQPPAAPVSSKYLNSLPSKCKYTVDNSKPSTDMEYDPLSNYSAQITGKRKRDENAHTAKPEDKKTCKLSGSDEEYVTAVKKPRQEKINTNKYTISESEGESSETEYRPSSLSSLLQRKGNSSSVGDTAEKEIHETAEGALNVVTHGATEEHRYHAEGQLDSGILEDVQQKDSLEVKKLTSQTGLEKSGKSAKVQKPEKEVKKPSSSKGSSSSKDKELTKKASQDSAKKENKSHGKTDDGKSTVKVKTADKVEKREKRSDKIRAVEKVKTGSGKQKKDMGNVAKESKILKTSEKEKQHSKHRDHQHKNGQLHSAKREKDQKKINKHSSNSVPSKSKALSSNVKGKRSVSPSNGNKLKDKRQTVSLSHADLFGDESPEEAEPIEVHDDEEEVEEVLVRKSANALRRGCLNKRKLSAKTQSSSGDEGHHGVGSISTDKDEEKSDSTDFSFFQDLDFESDPMEECLRIFNESSDVKREDKGRQAKQSSRDPEEDRITDNTLTTLFPGQKKRVSHFGVKGNTDAAPKPVVRPYRRPTAQEVCYQRMQLAQQQVAQLSAAVTTTSPTSSSTFSKEKKRIAHRPNPLNSSSKSSPADSKTASSQVLSLSQSQQSVKAQTTAGILSKTLSTAAQKRVAHTPTMKSTTMKRPVIPTEFGAKVPTNIRQRYLNVFIDECVKFCTSENAAFQMALDEEKLVYERSSSKNIYLNVAVNTLKKLRSESGSSAMPITKVQASVGYRRAQSHEGVLGGRLAATTSFTVKRMGKPQEESFTGAALFRKLKAYLMTEEELQEHGYPRKNPEAPGKAIINNLPKKMTTADPFIKICCRCGTEYMVNISGNCVRKEECNYHWGRVHRQKVAGGWETNYSCCSGAVGSTGCQVSKQHVQDGRKEWLDGYVSTFSKPPSPDGNGGVFALDCEMCYTKQGLELTRVTVIDSELKVIYDTFVKPDSKVVDYNTRFSGVTEEDLENTTITLRDVQAVLLSLFSDESILIGHSLESDFLALKLIHSSVVDTAIVFPHRLGLPYKRALKNLMADHLKRIIQDNVEGHDSSEDASACMELMIWKLKEDAKVKR